MQKPLTSQNVGALANQTKPILSQESPENQAPCASCGCDRINIVAMSKHSKHYAAKRCGQCDCFRGWVAKPKNTESRAAAQRALAQLLESRLLSDWERGFLTSIKNQQKLSPRQRETLGQIQARIGGEG